ncbi:MAG: DUF368 domain-containing protein [bacterium]|nr:DUF368 domain-containing protein [bacterium]
MEGRSLLQWLLISVRGVAMGAADVVPGVSGGTIAFITGIYEELILSLNNINLGALKILFKEGIKPFWKHINGTFFVFLFGGIGVSILLLADGVDYLLKNEPVMLWSFFFGLIIASIWLIGKSIKNWNAGVIVSLLIGTGVAFYIATIQTVAEVDAQWYIVLSGAIAICAMILPGVSGSFILVLLGSYQVVIGAIKEKDLLIIGLFALGCIVGLLTFARVLKILFEKFKEITIAILTGFMVGSLWKVWPWKNEDGSNLLVVHSDGEKEYAMYNVLPGDFKGDDQLLYAILCALGGLLLIVVLEKFAPKES